MEHYKMFSNYEEVDNTFEVTVADNGFVLKFNAKEIGNDDSWSSDVSFVFSDLAELSTAIDTLKELM
jgi:hypothetical protein